MPLSTSIIFTSTIHYLLLLPIMTYPENIEEKIGFDRIREQLLSYCLSSLGEHGIEELRFITDFEELKESLNRVHEFKDILLMGESFPAANYFDLREVLTRLEVEGTSLNQEELFDLTSSLQVTQDILKFFNEKRLKKYPHLHGISALIYFPVELLHEAYRIIDEKGEIRDQASPELNSIRKELRKLQSSSRSKIYTMLADAKRRGWTREDAEVTVRSGRVVIPLLANHKRSIKGFIHDESSTGQTAFLEPIELFENNNRLKELEIDQEQEIKKILFAFADYIRPELESLQDAFKCLGIFDTVRAKARFAVVENAHVPALVNEPMLDWKDAIHPILAMSHREKGKEVVSQEIQLNPQERVLIISGPNAGGKSVMLKTVALNQYMLQCALPITINPSSEAGIFEQIFVDIGDEQSIDNDLSTYSSHLKNIRFFMEKAGSKTLILIDEFGGGTEPDLGGAIAAATLQALVKKGAYAVVTTHYAQLKLLAKDFPSIANGAMLFDTKNLAPLYKFAAGKPGSSFAFEIAKSIGLQAEVLEKAEEIVGKEKIDFDFQLQDLENERELLAKKRAEFEQADDILAEMIAKYNKLMDNVKAKEREIIHKAKQEAKEILDSSNQQIEQAIHSIKSSAADKRKTAEVRKKLNRKKEQLKEELAKESRDLQVSKLAQENRPKNADIKTLEGTPVPGDHVVVKGQSTIGYLDSIQRKKAIVDFDALRMIVPLANLQRVVAPKKPKRELKSSLSNIMQDVHNRAANFNPNLDIRGKRAEDAIRICNAWLDEALLVGQKQVEVLHGKGDGILRMVLRDMLYQHKGVKGFNDAPIEFGGAGKTIVELK
jgi:DNA mismatch repair protein MutS2